MGSYFSSPVDKMLHKQPVILVESPVTFLQFQRRFSGQGDVMAIHASHGITNPVVFLQNVVPYKVEQLMMGSIGYISKHLHERPLWCIKCTFDDKAHSFTVAYSVCYQDWSKRLVDEYSAMLVPIPTGPDAVAPSLSSICVKLHIPKPENQMIINHYWSCMCMDPSHQYPFWVEHSLDDDGQLVVPVFREKRKRDEKKPLDPKNDTKAENGEPENQLCVICKERHRRVLFMPCNHVASCIECALDLDKRWNDGRDEEFLCPLCRDETDQLEEIFLK